MTRAQNPGGLTSKRDEKKQRRAPQQAKKKEIGGASSGRPQLGKQAGGQRKRRAVLADITDVQQKASGLVGKQQKPRAAQAMPRAAERAGKPFSEALLAMVFKPETTQSLIRVRTHGWLLWFLFAASQLPLFYLFVRLCPVWPGTGAWRELGGVWEVETATRAGEERGPQEGGGGGALWQGAVGHCAAGRSGGASRAAAGAWCAMRGFSPQALTRQTLAGCELRRG